MLRRLTLVLVGLLAVLTSAGAQAGTRDWVTDDFFIEQPDALGMFALPARRPTDCRQQIQRAVCVVTRQFDRAAFNMTRSCAPGAEPYVKFFESVYDQFPPVFQRMFCSVGAIYVEANLESVAYGGMYGSTAVMGIRKSIIDESLDISRLITWKEQLPFGGPRDSYAGRGNLPAVSIDAGFSGVETLAYYVLAHEFGHLFDFSNDLNSFTNCGPSRVSSQCKPSPGSWTALSWQNGTTPKKAFDFAHRRDVCFYNCYGRSVGRSDVASLYAGLSSVGFVTLYAATNVYDDLAESLAFAMLAGHSGAHYTLDTRQGRSYELLTKLQQPIFTEKLAYLTTFLGSPDIVYP